jgi:DNA-binding beta-propeller fold protein YncE
MRYALTVAALLCLPVLGPASAQAVSGVYVTASEQTFARPHDLVLSADGQRLYVSDVGNHAIKVLDPATLAPLAVIGEGELRSPHDVTFDGLGRLLVADTGNDRIVAYAVDGSSARLVMEWREGLASPEGVAVGPDGRIYVANAGGHTLVVFDGADTVARMGSRGDGARQFVRPHDVHVDAAGRVFVADPGNHRIHILSPALKTRSMLVGPPYDFNEPKYLTVDRLGWLYVADEYNNQVKILDRDYTVLAVIGDGEPGIGPGRFYRPEGVEVSGRHLWISDTYNNRIVRYRLEGAPDDR